MSEQTVVGLQPWLPGPLGRSSWWTEPVPAERLAAFRIGVAAVLLFDIVLTYWPHVHDFFGRDSLGAPWVFASKRHLPEWHWSVLESVEDPRVISAALAVWAGAAALLLVGLWSRASAAVAWALSLSFYNLNYFINNAGDTIKIIGLFYLMLSPCGATWSLDRWLRRRSGASGPVFIYPWPLRLLFVQMVVIYFFNGLHKIVGPQWIAGTTLHYVLADLTQARWSYAELPMPDWLARLLTWMVLIWELAFPVLVLRPWTRTAALLMGVGFHVGIGVTLELAGFPWYMLCLYLPLVPWERFTQRRPTPPGGHSGPASYS